MKKRLQQIFFILTIILFLLQFIYSIYNRYDLFIGIANLSPYLLSGYFIYLGVTLLAIVALFWRTPSGYLMFMIAPFHLWTTVFLAGSMGGKINWIGTLLFGLIIPLVFNLDFIRHLYLKQPNLWLSKFLRAMGIGIILGLFPLLFR